MWKSKTLKDGERILKLPEWSELRFELIWLFAKDRKTSIYATPPTFSFNKRFLLEILVNLPLIQFVSSSWTRVSWT